MAIHVRNARSFLNVAMLALASAACSSSTPKLGLDTAEPVKTDEIDLDEETRRVRELQKVRARFDYSWGGTPVNLENDGSAEDTARWAAWVCGGELARVRYQYANGATSFELWNEAQLVELRLCMARAYARMAQSARGPIVVTFEPDSSGVTQTFTMPVQSGGARVTLLARAAEYARYAWRMARADLSQYLATQSFVSGEDNHPDVFEELASNRRTVVEPEATAQAKLLGPIMREAYDRFQEYHDLLIEQIIAVSDAEMASSASTSIAAFRGVDRDVLSRSWAAHLLVGGDPGLPGLDGGRSCSTPALSPQAQRAIDIFRRAAPSPDDILGELSITELLNSNSQAVGSVRRRLVELFDETISNTVEERFQLRTQDFIEARHYLQDELRVYARKKDHIVPGSNPDLPRYAAVANLPSREPVYWSAIARKVGEHLELDLSFRLRQFVNETKRLLADKDGTAAENHDAIFGPIASVLSDLQEQYFGYMDHSGYGGAGLSLTIEANAKLKKLRIVKGEAGLSCATQGTIEGVPCSATEFSDLSRTLVEQHHDEEYYHYSTSSSFDFIYDSEVRLYAVHSPEGSEEPGHFKALVGGAAGAAMTIVPRLDERAGAVLQPNEKWCTQPKVGCAEGDNQFSFDARLPLENDLADDGDAVESSWRYYLNKAKEAAADADALGEAYILANLDADNRKETIEMREEARRAEAEEALSRLQTTCGTDVDPVALLNLLANGDVSKATDLSVMREDVDCSTDADCTKPGFKCMANSCIIDIQSYLDTHAQQLDPNLTEGLHRLSECIGTTTSTPFISLGNQPLCVFYLDTQSQLCQTTGTDKATTCPALAPVLADGTTTCTPCTSATQKNCYQVPLGANNARYKTAKIDGENLLHFFDTSKAQLHLSPRNQCNFLSDTLRWNPQALALNIDGVQTQVAVTRDVAHAWSEQIRASGLFHPDGGIKDLIKRIGFYSNFGATNGSGITLDNQVRYTPATKGNLWWYTADSTGLAAVLALKLSYPEAYDALNNVSFPYYVVFGDGDTVHGQTRPPFLWGGIPHSATDYLGYTDSAQKRRHLNGGEEECEDTWIPFDAEACMVHRGSPSFAFTTVHSTGQNPDTWWGYGSETGDLLVNNVHNHMAIGNWPPQAALAKPKSAWWWNGFSYARPVADPDEAKCPGGCNDVLTHALLERRDVVLTTPFKTGDYVVGDVRIHSRDVMKGLSLTTADLLRGAQLACELTDFENSFRCDPANPPSVNSVHDLAAVRQAMDCTANMIEGRAAQTVFGQFPERARNALRQQGVVGAFPQVGGEIGKMTSDIAGTLVGIKQAVADVAVEAKLVGLALDQLRTDAALKDVRDKIVDINFQSSVANLVTGCLKESAAAVGVTSIVQPGNVAAAAIGCANAVVQIDLAGKLQTAQQEENQLIYLSALNNIRENLVTRAANMQRLRSQLLADMSALDGQLALLETSRYDARRQLSRALYKASSQAKTEPVLTNVYANRASLSEKRYDSAYQRAVKLAFLARRAIEMRLGVDMSTLGEAYPLVEAPATWATTLCSSTGVDYDKLRKDSVEFRSTFQTSFQEQYIGTYVQKLEDFVEAYRLHHSFKEGQDTVIASLRDDILGVKTTCEVDSSNKIRNTSRVDRAWGPTGCASDAGCIRVMPVAGNEAGAPVYAPDDAELRAANPVAVYLGNDGDSPCVAPACGYAAGAGLVQKVFPTENLFPQTYVLSWYYPAGTSFPTWETDGPNLMEVLDENGQALPGFCQDDVGNQDDCAASGTVSTSRIAGWKRSWVRFKLEKSQTLTLRIGGKLDASAQGKRFYLAAPMLEAASGTNPLPSAFQGADEAGKRMDNTCGDPGGAAFRRQNWRRDCIKLCGDGYASSCSDVNATTQCYREVSFSLSQRDIELGRVLAASGFAQGNYNYRIQDLGINLVGTSLHDCSNSEAPETCYGSGNVQFSLVHSGPYLVRNHMGHDYEAQLFTGRIEHGRALATERYITNPMSSTDRDLLQTFMRGEFAGRPVDGRYALRIWESPSFDFNAIEDVQLVMNYRYWTRN